MARARHFDIRRQTGFTTIAMISFFILYLPIAVLVVFAFNAGENLSHWQGLSLRWFQKAASNSDVIDASIRSFQIALAASLIATVTATLAAIATTRTAVYRGLTAKYAFINLPLMVPEIVTAIATLIFFALVASLFNGFSFGIGNVIIAHIVFCIPFAFMPIRARLEDMDRTLEQAAADLYATPWHTFRRVTLPLLMPGITAGATLAFVVSFDDFTITQFVAGPGQGTLPIYIWSSLRRGITPEINAISSVLLAVSILLVTLSFLIGRRRK